MIDISQQDYNIVISGLRKQMELQRVYEADLIKQIETLRNLRVLDGEELEKLRNEVNKITRRK